MSLLRLTRPVYDAIRAHGEETYPYECCGALLGCPEPDGWRIEVWVKTDNMRTEAAHHRYEIAPANLIAIDREARSRGLQIAGFYHSHPDHPADWSTADFADAHWLGCCYVITAVSQGKAAATNAFLLAGAIEEDKHFERQTIQVMEASEILHATAESAKESGRTPAVVR